MKRVVGITNAFTDILYSVTEEDLRRLGIPKGKTIPIEKIDSRALLDLTSRKPFKKFLGGCPTNTLRSLNNLGFVCSLIGAVGEDDIGKEFLNQLFDEKIGNHFAKVPGKKSGRIFVLVAPDGERSFVMEGEAYTHYFDADFENLPNPDLFYSSGYEFVCNPKKMLSFIESLKKSGTKIGFDFASEVATKNCPEFFKKMISKSDIVFASKEELEVLGGLKENLIDGKTFILKKGEEGSRIYHDGESVDISPFKNIKIINTNGAGDSYAAGFLYKYLLGEKLRDCGNFATHIASKVCAQEESWYKGD